VGRRKGRGPRARPRRRWQDNIKMDLKHDGRTWTRLIWLRARTSDRQAFVNTAMHLPVQLLKEILTSHGIISFSRRTFLYVFC